MITTTRTYIRTDLSIPWHLDFPFSREIHSQEFKDHVDSKYIDKKINHTYIRSDDGLTLTFYSFWKSLEYYQEYMNDPICLDMFAKRDAHNKRFGIVSEPSIIEEE
jgi:hypothetical protein